MSVTLPMTRPPAARAGSAQSDTTTASTAIKIVFFMTRSFRESKLSMSGGTHRVRQGIPYASCFEGAQAQHATIAGATGFALFSVTRPGQLQRRAQLEAAPDDLRLAKCDERSHDLDASLFGADPNELIESVVVVRTAVRVAGAILRDRADVDLLGSEDLRPTDRRRKKMRVAEGNVGDRDASADVS